MLEVSGIKRAMKIKNVRFRTLLHVQWNLYITKGQETGKNMFAVSRFRYIGVLFHILYWGEEVSFVIPRTSLYRGSTDFYEEKFDTVILQEVLLT